MFSLTRQKSRKNRARRLYEAALTQARQPVFYNRYGIPDTVDGRYDLIVMHVCLLMEGLHEKGHEGTLLFQPLFDAMFRDFEFAAREMGIGDLSIPRHMKRMMQGFHGRAHSYREALDEEENPAFLIKAIERNIYGTVECVDQKILNGMADYMIQNIVSLKGQDLISGQAVFLHLIEDKEIQEAA